MLKDFLLAEACSVFLVVVISLICSLILGNISETGNFVIETNFSNVRGIFFFFFQPFLCFLITFISLW